MQSFIIFFIIVIIFLYFYGYHKYYVKNKNLPKCDIFYIKEDKDLLQICSENNLNMNNVPNSYTEYDNYHKLNTNNYQDAYKKNLETIFSEENYIFNFHKTNKVSELMHLPQIKSFIRHGISKIERDSTCDDVDKFDYYGDGDYEFTDTDNNNTLD